MSQYADFAFVCGTQSINHNVGYNEPDDSYIQHVSDGRCFNQPGTSTYDVFHEPQIYVPQVTEGLCNISLKYGSGSWDQHVTGGNEYFYTNTADHEIELASPDQDDANTHVDNSDTEPEISSDEFDEESAMMNMRITCTRGHHLVMSEEILYNDKSRHFSRAHMKMLSFFTTMFGEEIPDSVGVPS
ncbi:hypothetical protein F511_35109 [Dorcoceras hygrometricum]|uniref:Uncharacterized protein n=1 Tax=Dorcoceras hygrometricum TaxID=472368 RepID=A0A2Z7D371_9LAMI|nr:hypothetical protein F511_35109 [Dorcoceras hygrometricum]